MKTMSNKRIILASKSPRRKELMGLLFPQFEVQASDVDETLPEGVSLGRAVELLALRKGQAVAGAEPDALGTCLIHSGLQRETSM